MAGSRTALVLLAGAVICALLAGRNDALLFDGPEARVSAARERLRVHLERKDIELLYAPGRFPGLNPVNGYQFLHAGTDLAEGRWEPATEFDGRMQTYVVFPQRWQHMAENFTLVMDLLIEPSALDQDILFSVREPVCAGLKLDRGRMAWFYTTESGTGSAGYPFEAFGSFVRIGVSVDTRTGAVKLYENGILKASSKAGEPLVMPGTRLEIGKSTRRKVVDPFRGRVEEAVIFSHAADEALHRDLAAWEGPIYTWAAGGAERELASAQQRIKRVRQFLKAADLFKPGLHLKPEGWSSLPEVHLVLSSSDRRYLAASHEAARARGRRSADDAAVRTMHVMSGGSVQEAGLQLFGSDTVYPREGRPSYLLTVRDTPVLDFQRLRLVPPEHAGWIGPGVELAAARAAGLPVVRSRLCRLVVNGDFNGIFYAEDAAQMGVAPGEGVDRFLADTPRTHWTSLGHGGFPGLEHEVLERIVEDEKARLLPLLSRDRSSPFSSREIVRMIEDATKRSRTWPLGGPPGTEIPEHLRIRMAGTNLSPDFILHDLALDGTWHSSDPAVITGDGQVSRSGLRQPAEVVLRNDTGVQLSFRVMPEVLAVPALFLWQGEGLNRSRRVDFCAEYFAAGSGTRQVLYGTQDNRGGLAYRGNTSLRQPKKPLSLKFSEPHGWWGDDVQVSANLVNPYHDPTYLRNRLCYEVFAGMSPGSPVHRGLPVTWVEVFLNGEYYGLFEMSPPVNADWLKLAPFDRKDPFPAAAYKLQHAPPTAGPARPYRQAEPSTRFGQVSGSLDALLGFLELPLTESRYAALGNLVHLENFRDFHLLLEFSENANGEPFNYPLHDVLVREAGQDARFFMVPWDFDDTFLQRPYARFESRVLRRLREEVPAYRTGLADRWRVLRDTVLSSAALHSKIDAWSDLLAPYAGKDRDRWQASPGYGDAVNQLKVEIDRRLAELDVYFTALQESAGEEKEP